MLNISVLAFGGFNRCSPNKVEVVYDVDTLAADSAAWDAYY